MIYDYYIYILFFFENIQPIGVYAITSLDCLDQPDDVLSHVVPEARPIFASHWGSHLHSQDLDHMDCS